MTTTEDAPREHSFRIEPDVLYEGDWLFPTVFGTQWKTHLNARCTGGDVPRATKIGRKLWYRGSDVLAWLERGADPVPAAAPDA